MLNPDEIERRMAETDRMLAEVDERRGVGHAADGTVTYPDGIKVRPEIAATAPPLAQQVKYESDFKPRFTPAPDFMKPSNQAAMDLARMQRDQKMEVDLAIARSEAKAPRNNTDAAIIRNAINNNPSTQAAAAHPEGGQFVPYEGMQVHFDNAGNRTFLKGMAIDDVVTPSRVPPLPQFGDARRAPGAWVENAAGQRIDEQGNPIMDTADEIREATAELRRANDPATWNLDRRMADLEGAMDGLVYQMRQLIQRLPQTP